jgi:hypothetical protein
MTQQSGAWLALPLKFGSLDKTGVLALNTSAFIGSVVFAE